MLDNWGILIDSGAQEIDVEREITATAGEIIAKTSFGISYQSGRLVYEKLRALQMTLFKTSRFVGVPFGKIMHPKKTLEARRLGQEINQLFLSIISARKKSMKESTPQHDLLGILLKQSEQGGFTKALTTQDLVDECKTFFFGGHETTALAITWTMLLLATHQDWQDQLREEIREVVGDKEIDVNMLAGLKKVIIHLYTYLALSHYHPMHACVVINLYFVWCVWISLKIKSNVFHTINIKFNAWKLKYMSTDIFLKGQWFPD